VKGRVRAILLEHVTVRTHGAPRTRTPTSLEWSGGSCFNLPQGEGLSWDWSKAAAEPSEERSVPAAQDIANSSAADVEVAGFQTEMALLPGTE
jgi:hypothetical protein